MKGLVSASLCLVSLVVAQDCNKVPSTDPDDCCKTPMIMPAEVFTDCVAQYGEMRKRSMALPGPPRGCCIGDCITMKMGANPTADGNLDRPALKASLIKALGANSGVWQSTLETAIEKCFKVADSRMSEWNEIFKLPPGFEGEKVCHAVSGEVLACLTNEIFLTCPGSVAKQSAECAALKDFVKKCEIIPIPQTLRTGDPSEWTSLLE